MANNDDVVIDIGVNLDADKFEKEYNAVLKKLTSQTRKVITETMSGMSGTAAKSWGELPFSEMHDATGGKTAATKAFVASLSHDLETQGIAPGSLGYQSALLNASYRATTPDPWQRYHQMLASGYTEQADATHPDSMLSKTIETDYALLSQSWARQFITESKKGQFIDFGSMRDYAVDAGLGKWIDPKKEKTADNFELIDNELESIQENSNKSDKTFRGWNDTLKNVLGTLTAIGSLTAIGKTFEIAYNAAEKGTVQGGTTLDRRRAFIGMSALDVLATQKAGQSIGLGKDDIYNEILGLSEGKEKYKLLGEGLNELYPSLTGIFDNIMSSDNPYDIYKGIITELYGRMEGADDNTRARTLMLLSSQGLGSISEIIGAFLSNSALADMYGNNPLGLFNLKDNPYYGSYGRAEGLLPQIATLNESIKASYTQMYDDWVDAFGLPFKKWWDKTLINTVIPWFEKIINYVSPESKEKRRKESNYKLAEASLDTDDPWRIMRNDTTMSEMALRTAASHVVTNIKDDKAAWDAIRRSNFIGGANIKGLFGDSAWDKSVKFLADFDPLNRDKDDPNKWFKALQKAASKGAYDKNLTGDDAKNAEELQFRAGQALRFLEKTGLGKRLTDLTHDDSDTATIRLLQKYLSTGQEALLDDFLYSTYGSTQDFKEILNFINEYRDYLKQNPQKVMDIKITLFDQFGHKLQAEVDKTLDRK